MPHEDRRSTLDQPNPIPPPTSGPTPKGSTPPGLRAQLMATRDSAWRLALAHLDLAKAEFQAIGGQIARAAALGGLAIALVLFAISLLVIGTAMFTGEWLLGSIGWGVLHGFLVFIGVAVAAVMLAVGVSGGRIAGAFVVALIVGILVSIVFALNLPNQLYTAIGDAALPNVESGVRPLVVGTLVGAGVGLLLGIAMAIRLTTAGSRFGALIGMILVGAAIGAFTAITFGVQVGVGIGATIGWAMWIALMGIDVSRTGIDVETLKLRFYPHQTIETSKETLEWLQSKMPPGNGS